MFKRKNLFQSTDHLRYLKNAYTYQYNIISNEEAVLHDLVHDSSAIVIIDIFLTIVALIVLIDVITILELLFSLMLLSSWNYCYH